MYEGLHACRISLPSSICVRGSTQSLPSSAALSSLSTGAINTTFSDDPTTGEKYRVSGQRDAISNYPL